MKHLHHKCDGKWLKYLFPIERATRTAFYALTPWCFYIHGVRGVLELPKNMYTGFTLLLSQERQGKLIIAPDYSLHEVFPDGGFETKNKANSDKAVRSSVGLGQSRIMRVDLYDKDQLILIRDSFFEKKIDSVINTSLIHNAIIRMLLSDLLKVDANIKTEVTETLHAIANMVFILTSKRQIDEEVKDRPFEVIVNAIVENYKDKDFNLDRLSSMVLMSRRKVQYVISGAGETFTSLVNKVRVEEMKLLIRKKPSVRLTELTDAVGIKSCYSATKIFNRCVGISIKEYKEKCKVLN